MSRTQNSEFLRRSKLVNFLIYKINQNTISDSSTANNKPTEENLYNFIICIEDECIIIDEMTKDNIESIIIQLKQAQKSLINVGKFSILDPNCLTAKEIEESNNAKDEVKSFCDCFIREIHKNKIIKNLLEPMIGYLIRRYYYPSGYFKDPSFFIFDKKNESKEQIVKNEIQNLFNFS